MKAGKIACNGVEIPKKKRARGAYAQVLEPRTSVPKIPLLGIGTKPGPESGPVVEVHVPDVGTDVGVTVEVESR
jgi:hypothetical protein